MDTIYSKLMHVGYTDEEIRAAEEYPSTRQFSLVVTDTPDGYPMVGVKYMCDFRYEEEAGTGKLSKLFMDTDDQSKHVRVLGNGMVLFGDVESSREAASAISHYSQSLAYAQGTSAFRDWMYNVKELRALAAEQGVSLKGLTKRDDIVAALSKHHYNNAKADKPNTWPGYFHNGSTLGLRAGKGIVADVLQMLVDAAAEGTLGVGNANVGFGSGFSLYDLADMGPKLKAEITEANDQYRKDMDALEPVAAELKDRGYNWYFLGNPSDINGAKRYWLNGYSLPKIGQPFGWYTLDELLAEQFVTDQEIEAARKAYRYDSRGSTRKDIIYTEVGEIDYRAMAERDGTSLEGLALED